MVVIRSNGSLPAHSKTTALFSMIPGRLGIPEPFTGVDTLEKLDPQLQPEELEYLRHIQEEPGCFAEGRRNVEGSTKCSFKTAS